VDVSDDALLKQFVTLAHQNVRRVHFPPSASSFSYLFEECESESFNRWMDRVTVVLVERWFGKKQNNIR